MNGIGSAHPLRAIGQGRRAGRPGTATHLDAPLRRVDPDVAHDIAQLFLDAPALGGERLVSAAYRELQVQTDLQFAELTEPDGPFGYTVVWTKLSGPYSTETELIEAVRATGVLEITAARADRDRLHPALECAAGGPYGRLRAVHDIVGHVMTGYGFDRDGEYSAWLPAEQALSRTGPMGGGDRAPCRAQRRVDHRAISRTQRGSAAATTASALPLKAWA
jgi:hypothetical protein